MNKLTKTAKTLDTIANILQVITAIGIVASFVVALILAAGVLFGLDPSQLGELEYTLSLGNYTIEFTEYAPMTVDQIWIYGAATTAIGSLELVLTYVFIKITRQILASIKEGQPFQDTTSKNLKKLGKLGIIMCAADAVVQLAVGILTTVIFSVQELFGSYVSGIDFVASINMAYLLVAGVCFLLSYIFEHGTQLQQLSDETL